MIFCYAHIFWGVEVWAQSCAPCTHTITSSTTPFPSNQNASSVICFQGNFTYSNEINLNGSKLCIGPGVTLNKSNGGNWNGNWTVNNYGTFNPNNLNLNGGTTINNYGTLNITGPKNYGGVLNSYGELNVNGNITFQSNSPILISGTATISGHLENNSTISLAGTLTAGTLKINGSSKIEALNGNQCNSISVSGEFYTDSNGGITGNDYDYQQSGSALVVNKMPTGNANPKLAGGATVGHCPSVVCHTSSVITDVNGYDVVYIYRCSDVFVLPQIIANEELIDAQILTLAGGGGGGYGDASGGGGAGGISYQDNVAITPLAEYSVTVGYGGTGSLSANAAGRNGLNSAFHSIITSQGGGGGGSTNFNNGNGNNGGFGGGGAYNGNSNGNGGNSTTNNSNRGGSSGNSGNGNQRSGGGGAGANGPGINGNGNTGGNGADGVDLSRSCGNCPAYATILLGVDEGILNAAGISKVVAAGGGGVGSNPGQGNGGGRPSAGNGGSSIGGNGNRDARGFNGKDNSGSGGGGGRDGGGSGSNGLVIIRVTYRILPVELLSFNASYQSRDRSALLEWSTVKEWGNSHFELERAVNNVKEWQTIGSVEGNGYSEIPVRYSYLDKDLPKSGGSIFYRLKQVDYSGKFSYSNTKAIEVTPINGSTAWVAYPNPSSSDSDIAIDLIQLHQYQDEVITISLTNLVGTGETQTFTSPDEVSPWVSTWIRNKSAGLYILDIQWGDHSQQIKLLRN